MNVETKNINSASPSPAMSKAKGNAIDFIETANAPLVKPSDAKGGVKTTAADKAKLNTVVSEGLAHAISARAEEAKARLLHQSECAAAIADYYSVIDATQNDTAAGQTAQERIEEATGKVSKAFADAILANAYDRSTARRKLGEAFGFVVSPKTGKPTSRPAEPGNSISKRVSSVTIAAEYAMTGILPERGGDSLPLVGKDRLQEELADYFDGHITVRAASERIETAIREARENLPLEMSPDKILKLAGKIETASEKIAISAELREAYATLFSVIASVPFTDDETE